ncbi:MAG: CPBP family glutamic-type intramembrane protease [Phycisphaerae bacterium]
MLGDSYMWLLRPIRLDYCTGIRQFMFRILVQQFALKGLLAIFIVSLIPDAGVADHGPLNRQPLLAFFVFVLVAPPLETLLFQVVTIETMRTFKRSRLFQFLAGSVPFAALHFVGGVASGIAAGMVGGIFFSHTYLECRNKSWWTSTWVTTVTHSLHNLIVFPIVCAFAK